MKFAISAGMLLSVLGLAGCASTGRRAVAAAADSSDKNEPVIDVRRVASTEAELVYSLMQVPEEKVENTQGPVVIYRKALREFPKHDLPRVKNALVCIKKVLPVGEGGRQWNRNVGFECRTLTFLDAELPKNDALMTVVPTEYDERYPRELQVPPYGSNPGDDN